MESIFYRKLGKGHPLILIHGFCETHEIWNGFADQLSKKFEVFVIDLPGFGGSPLLQAPFTLDQVGIQVCHWVAREKIANPVVIGHSLGGYVTLAMAAREGEKFAGIGLFQSTAFPDSEERKASRNKVIEFVKAHGIDPYIDTFVPGLFLDKKHPAIPEVDRIARKTLKETLLGYAAAMRDRPSSVDFLKNCRKPVLILGGAHDTIVPAAVTEQIGQLAPQSKVRLIENIGHMAMYESRNEALEIVEEFVTKSGH
ncbi:alpha/beta hydrolase [Cytophagales bacterium WSM2-2]|nr:alpha/beta hydrolase [Cytophagales bacterium WSM2-2]